MVARSVLVFYHLPLRSAGPPDIGCLPLTSLTPRDLDLDRALLTRDLEVDGGLGV